MPKSRYLEAGAIAGTHGVRGMIRIKPWSDTPDFLTGFGTLYIDEKPVKTLRMSVHKSMVLAELEGVDTLEKAMALKGKVVKIDREDAALPEGRHFIADLLGLVCLTETGETIGKITEVLNLPSNDVYVVEGERKYLIPVVPEFVLLTDIDSGTVTIRLIEGMEADAN